MYMKAYQLKPKDRVVVRSSNGEDVRTIEDVVMMSSMIKVFVKFTDGSSILWNRDFNVTIL